MTATRVRIAEPEASPASSSSAPSSDPIDSPLQVLFMGTGTSTALPIAPCLARVEPHTPAVAAFLSNLSLDAAPEKGAYDPQGAWPKNIACSSCRSAVDRDVPQGWKNRRGNPGLVLRRQDPAGKWKNVVVDVGKTFREQSCRLFPQWGVKTVDAVIITHGHADAYFGLDDLREWCQRQGRPIPIYLNRSTYENVAASFPYLVDKTQASGGGDIPSLSWVVVDDESEFEVEGIHVTTLPVHHGRYFDTPAKPPTAPTTASAPSALPPPQPVARPYICLGFVFDRSIVYLSDVSSIPDRVWDRMIRTLQDGVDRRSHRQIAAPPAAVPTNPVPPSAEDPAVVENGINFADQDDKETPVSIPSPPVLIIDTLWPIRQHTSHISFAQAVTIALKLKPEITYFLGMTHPTTHFEWEELGLSIRSLDGRRGKGEVKEVNGVEGLDAVGAVDGSTHPDRKIAATLVKQFWASEEVSKVAKEMKKWKGRVEPAWDGLGVEVDVHRPVERVNADGEGEEEARWRMLPPGEGSAIGWPL